MKKELLKISMAIFSAILLTTAVSSHAGSADSSVPEYTEPPGSKNVEVTPDREPCPTTKLGDNMAQTVLGVKIQKDLNCNPDNPKRVATFVKGTNNVPRKTLMQTGLSEDTVQKGKDLDGDGDPDIINITLEVAEINGKKPSNAQRAVSQEIAPGVKPGFWVFAPKTRGMASESSDLVRVPSPTIRIEQGDRVSLTLENTHYMPHTIHFHGVDHGFNDSSGEGNDGVPQTSEQPVMPGESRTYDFKPRQSGTMAYHCHVQPQSHVLMGLNGMFVVSQQAENNTLQTFNIGGGKVRSPSKKVEKNYDQEYDYIYQDVDQELHEIINISNDPRVVSKMMNRGYDVTERTADYFLLNGKSFPYTVRESQIIVKPNQSVKLRALNTGKQDIDLHTHGHKPTVTQKDGVKTSHPIQRDVFKMGSFQRLDMVLNTTNNGLDSYGSGVWLMHNHKENAVTTDGIAPGGDLSTITYESELKSNGMPNVQGVSWENYWSTEYYERKVPVWQSYDPTGLLGSFGKEPVSIQFTALIAVAAIIIGGIVGMVVVRE